MKPEIKTKWVAALRSGEYKQAQGSLRVANDKFCCLGVLCDLHSKETGEAWGKWSYLERGGSLPRDVVEWSDVSCSFGNWVVIAGELRTLSNHNDDGHTFAEIADAIEAQL